MTEYDDGTGMPQDVQSDPELVNLNQNIRRKLAEAREKGPTQFAETLDLLSGRAVFSIMGTVYVPRLSRAFGDWIIVSPEKPTGDSFEIIGEEQIDTQPPDPFVHRGHEAFTIIHSYVRFSDGKVVITAEQDFEDGAPRILYPLDLQRFELLRVRAIDIFTRREMKHDERFLRGFSLDSQP